MDASKLGNVKEHLGLEEPKVSTVETKATAGKPARVKEITVSMRVSPKGTYSSAEFSQTLEINSESREVVKGITQQLKEDVKKNAIDSARMLIVGMSEEGMI